MPYVSEDSRAYLIGYEDQPEPRTPGELNYVVSRLCDRVLGPSPRYGDYNDIVGVLECVKQEIYARLVRPYEDNMMLGNGDVFTPR